MNKKAIWIKTLKCAGSAMLSEFRSSDTRYDELQLNRSLKHNANRNLDIFCIRPTYGMDSKIDKRFYGAPFAKHKHPEIFKNTYTFAVVRNPWDRFISGAYYMRGSGVLKYKGPLLSETLFKILEDRDNPNTMKTWGHIMWTQTDALSDINGNALIPNKIIRFEALQEGLNEVCSDIGIAPILLPNVKSKHKHYTKYYTDEYIERIGELFKDDITNFGYTFNGHDDRFKKA